MALCTITLPNGSSIQPDTAEVFEHVREAEVTEHPVEDGSAISDHIIVKPKTFTITTNWTPFPNDVLSLPAPGESRPDQAFTILATMVENKATLRIELDGITYTPVVLTKVTMQRVFADGNGRTIHLDCKEIQIVQGRLVTAKVAAALKPKAAPKKKKITPKVEGYPVQYFQKSWVDGYGPDGVPTPAETVAVPKAKAAPIAAKVINPEPPTSMVRLYQYELP